MDGNNAQVMDESSDESINQNKQLNNSIWHPDIFGPSFHNSTTDNDHLREYVIPKVEIDYESDIDESEDCSTSVQPQPDSTNNQKHCIIEGESNESTVMSWIPNVSLRGFHDSQQATSSSHDVLENIQPVEVLNKHNGSSFQSIECESVVFGKLITNEMMGIKDPKILTKFKEKILQVILKLNTGNL